MEAHPGFPLTHLLLLKLQRQGRLVIEPIDLVARRLLAADPLAPDLLVECAESVRARGGAALARTITAHLLEQGAAPISPQAPAAPAAGAMAPSGGAA